jgi:hypothetical protein
MKRRISYVVLGALLAAGLPALAQKTPNVAQISIWKVKPGATGAFAEGRKKHMEWHRAQKDTFSWLTWEIVNGDRAGQLITGSFGHYWKDFDGREAFEALDDADVAKSTGASAEVVTSGYWVHMTDHSRMKPGATAPPKFNQLTHYYVSLSQALQFEDAIKEVSGALNKIEWPVYSSWYRLVSGGDGPHYVLSTERANYADFAGPEKSLLDALSPVLGGRRASELLQSIRDATERTYTELIMFRPDLSYMAPAPASK